MCDYLFVILFVTIYFAYGSFNIQNTALTEYVIIRIVIY